MTAHQQEITLDTPAGMLHLTWPGNDGTAESATAELDGVSVTPERAAEIVAGMQADAVHRITDAANELRAAGLIEWGP